jgi:hypothetical protein
MLARFEQILMASCLVLPLFAACIEDEGTDGRFDDDDGTTAVTVGSTSAGGGSSVGGGSAMGGASASSSGGATTTTTTSSSGAGGACVDDGPEPNETEATATDLGLISDCNADVTLDGVLAGADVDWYKYSGSDDFGISCSVDPYRSIMADGQVRICKFFECDGLSVTCPMGSTVEVSPDGRDGCCGLNNLDISINCSGISDDATVYIRLDKPPAFQCVDYAMSYHY